MTQIIINWLQGWPPELASVILSAMPGTESDFVIPYAIRVWHLNPASALFFSLLGNALPFLPLFFGLEHFRIFLTKYWPALLRPVDRLIGHAHGKIEKHYARYGVVALLVYVALPLPLTGIWSATIAAVVLKVPFKYAALGIFSGMILAGLIVMGITLAI